jgi:ABC-type nitrate/sulfonate/bicarbonate transport system substrate-binding protein
MRISKNAANTQIVTFISISIITLGLCGCNGCNQNQKSVTSLTIGIQNSPSNSLVIVAAAKVFFDTTKVKVDVKEFSAGKLALQALLGQSNDLDVAVSAETPVVLSTLGSNKFKVVSQIVDAKNECRVVVRKDDDLNTPEKYFSKSRKLSTSQGGSPEWLTYNFIKKYNLDKSKIQIIAMLPENMPAALSSKAVDAISIFDPYARIGETQLGKDGLTFLNTDITSYYVMSVKEQVITEKGQALEELLKGLIKAQDFIKNHPEEAKQIVAQKTKLDIAIINATWSNYNFGVGLNQALVNLCIDQSNWAIETGKYPSGTAIPDYKMVLSNEILKKVAPNTVNY